MCGGAAGVAAEGGGGGQDESAEPCANLAFHFSFDLALKTAAFLRVLGGWWVETLFDGWWCQWMEESLDS